MKEYRGVLIPYVRPSERTNTLQDFHHRTGHAGVKRMLETMRGYVYWENLASDVDEYVGSCTKCAQFRQKPSQLSYRLILPGYAFHTVSIYVVGPIGPGKTARGNRFIIVTIDHLTKWVECAALPGPTSLKTARFVLTDIIARHGCPAVLLSDNGTNFAHSILPRLNELMGTESAYSAPYRPETNGMVERVNGTLVRIIKKLAMDKPSSWDEYLP